MALSVMLLVIVAVKANPSHQLNPGSPREVQYELQAQPVSSGLMARDG
jgi:hypothetical protein